MYPENVILLIYLFIYFQKIYSRALITSCRYMYTLYHWAHVMDILISVLPASSLKRLQAESRLRSVYARSLHFIPPLPGNTGKSTVNNNKNKTLVKSC
jgi:hypothetical protein